MFDIVEGPVTSVLDGDTFDMSVSHIGTNNVYAYNSSERIRIAEIDAPELSTALGVRSALAMMLRLAGKRVRCYVRARDVFHRLVADVHLLN